MKKQDAMTVADFATALDPTSKIDLSMTGRVTGRRVSAPVWFVRHGAMIGVGEFELAAVGTPIEDRDQIRGILDYFREKYGNGDVAVYYPHSNVAVAATRR